MSDWQHIDTAPVGEVVMTKIDDADGCRNEQRLKRIAGNNLWWTPSGDMYVYYRPTHWRPAAPDRTSGGENG